MSYTDKTTNYELPQWQPNDKPKWLTDVNTAFETIDAGMEANKQSAALANQKGDNNTSAISEINTTIQNMQNQDTTLATQVQNNAQQIALHTTHLNEHDTAIAGLKTSVNNNNSDIAGLSSTVQDIQNEIGGTGGGSTSIDSRITALRQDVDGLNANVGNVDTLTTESKIVVGAVNEVKASADSNATNIGNVEDLETDAKTVVGAVNELKQNEPKETIQTFRQQITLPNTTVMHTNSGNIWFELPANNFTTSPEPGSYRILGVSIKGRAGNLTANNNTIQFEECGFTPQILDQFTINASYPILSTTNICKFVYMHVNNNTSFTSASIANGVLPTLNIDVICKKLS